MKDLEIHHVWNYLKETLDILKNTILKDYLLNKNKNKLEFTNFYYFENTKMNLKNIYNISKSLSHLTINKNWKKMPKLFISLRDEKKNHFFKKLFNIENNWIQLKKNLDKQSGKKLSISEYRSKLRNILSDFEKNWMEIFWKNIIKKGIISTFQVNLDLTDNINTPSSFSEKIYLRKLKLIINQNKDNLNNSYYFLTVTNLKI